MTLFLCRSKSLLTSIPFQVSGTTYSYNIKQAQVPDSSQGQFIKGTEPGSTWVAYLNICGDAKAVGCGKSTPICQDDGAGNFVSMGTPQSWTVGPYYDPTKGKTSTPLYNMGVQVSIANGDTCVTAGQARQSNMWFKCDNTVSGPITTATIAETDPSNPGPKTTCIYWFQPIPHSMFCPGGGGGSGDFDYGWVFVIIVLCGLFLYFVVGIIILKFVQHKEGREVVPNVDFWAGLPSLVIDGMKYALCCVPCRGGGGYTEV